MKYIFNKKIVSLFLCIFIFTAALSATTVQESLWFFNLFIDDGNLENYEYASDLDTPEINLVDGKNINFGFYNDGLKEESAVILYAEDVKILEEAKSTYLFVMVYDKKQDAVLKVDEIRKTIGTLNGKELEEFISYALENLKGLEKQAVTIIGNEKFHVYCDEQ